MFTNLRELIQSMPDEQTCINYLSLQRWADGIQVCPYCGVKDRAYVIEGGKRFKCPNGYCHKKYSVRVGTIFEASNLPLAKWFTAIYLLTAHKKGISSYQLGKDIGISQKSSWFMLHRIREMMRAKSNVKLDNIVEIDETYIGGKVGNMSNAKRKAIKEAGVLPVKEMVIGMIERAGQLKLIAVPVGKSQDDLHPLVKDNVDTDAVLITDTNAGYQGLQSQYATHETVNHTQHEYVRDGFHTNTIEGAFSQFKRSIYGIYHFCTAKHLSRYCDETMFRYNLRGIKDYQRFTLSIQSVEGRLTYKKLIEVKEVKKTVVATIADPLKGTQRAIVQLQDGVIINQYVSLNEAARLSGLTRSMIGRVLKGERKTSHGYVWKYL